MMHTYVISILNSAYVHTVVLLSLVCGLAVFGVQFCQQSQTDSHQT